MENPRKPMNQKPTAVREMRWFADALEQAQRARIQAGERIRALVAITRVDGESAPAEAEGGADVGGMLQRIRDGETDGPVPALGRAYRRGWEQELEMGRCLEECLRTHPAWPWLRHVQGVGPSLAGKLVARLDVTRAETPSAFWAYCGLATVPGMEYRCATCGLTGSYPVGSEVATQHVRRGGGGRCTGELRPVRGSEGEVRVAQPKPGHGERSAYDQQAKKLCYLIGTSLLRAGDRYEQYYRRERAKLDETRANWAEGRKHLTALRKMEKLFLSHLWLVWRQAEGLPVTQPYAQEGRDTSIDPWAMVDPVQPRQKPRRRLLKPGERLPAQRLPAPEKARPFRHSRS